MPNELPSLGFSISSPSMDIHISELTPQHMFQSRSEHLEEKYETKKLNNFFEKERLHIIYVFIRLSPSVISRLS